MCALVLATSGSAMVGCSGNSSGNDGAQQGATSQEAGYTFTDDLGNQVTVSSHERVVAGMGSFANIWELAGGTLVGASNDAFSDYHIESKAEKVGDFSSLNAESIIALDPDFVILTGANSGRGGGVAQTDLKDTLQAAGIAVAYFNVTTFDDYLRMLKTCCDITGNTKAYEENGTNVAENIAAIKKKAEGKSAGSVAVLTTYSGGTRVQASSTSWAQTTSPTPTRACYPTTAWSPWSRPTPISSSCCRWATPTRQRKRHLRTRPRLTRLGRSSPPSRRVASSRSTPSCSSTNPTITGMTRTRSCTRPSTRTNTSRSST